MAGKKKIEQKFDIFESFKQNILNTDVIHFIENNLTLDGKPFSLTESGYKPFVDIYRYIALKSIEPNSKPIVLVKGRQVGATTMASALECYFMACGLYGTSGRPPMRIGHLFPTLAMAAIYTKTKLNTMISQSKPMPGVLKSNGMLKSFMESKIDSSNPSNDSLFFKLFTGGNTLFIESTGIDGDRLRGRSCDVFMFDECFPYDQNIEIEGGKIKIGKLYDLFFAGKQLPLVKTYNEKNDSFEYKKILNAWCRGERKLVKLTCGNREIKCTTNHKFLTTNGWKMVSELEVGNIIKTTSPITGQISKSLNDDQMQIMLGSFLGDGHIRQHGLNRYRVAIIHGIKQQDYCEWKASMFDAKPTYLEKNGYSQKPAVTFRSKLFALENKFPQTKKTCPQWILDKLDARGLAIWIMDDGAPNMQQMGMCLSTCSFDEESQIRIVEKLKSMGIDCHYKFYKTKNRKSDGYFYVLINKEAYLKLCDIVKPYIHPNIFYKIRGSSEEAPNYKWNNSFNNHGLIVVDKIENTEEIKNVYDIEVEDNHNFIVTSVRKSKNLGGLIAHNCQDIPSVAIGTVNKILAQAHYGKVGHGVQVYFGTPKQKGTHYYNIWQMAHQHYYHLRCRKCNELFPLYRPDVNWEEIWLYGYIVKCTKCGEEQDKRQAAENGKWVAINGTEEGSKYIGYHINQLYMPTYTKETILDSKPERNPNNTERLYQNEVLGEFYSGEGGLMSPEQVYEVCGDAGRKFSSGISADEKKRVYAGFDWGQKGDLDQLRGHQRGQSYSCGIILTAETPNRFIIEYGMKLKRNDPEYKLEAIEELYRRYSILLGVGDIGDAYDLTHVLQRKYGERFLASRAVAKVNGHIRYNKEIFPKEIMFERDYFYSEIFGLLKSGSFRFPMGSYEQVASMVEHCCSMDIKVGVSRQGDPVRKYVKGPTPNDFFCALANAYLAYKFHITQGFNIKQPQFMKYDVAQKRRQIPAIVGYIPRWR